MASISHRSLPLLVVALLAAAPARADVAVDACEQVVPEGQTAYLVRDLDCTDACGGVVLSDDSRLLMGGHSIVAANDPSGALPADPHCRAGVRCEAGTDCTVEGPGLIAGFPASGIAGTHVRVEGVTIRGNGRVGIAAYGNVVALESVIVGNGQLGVHSDGRVKLVRSLVAEHPQGRSRGWRVRER